MSISDDDISLDITLYIDSSEIHLEYEGKLYRSFRYTDEQPVYIGVFENDETIDNSMLPAISTDSMYEIIYFEISNGKSPYNLDSNLRRSPSLTISLRNKLNGAIYDMGSELDLPIVLDGIEEQAPSDNDLTWFLKYINGTYVEVENTSTEVNSVLYPTPNDNRTSIWLGDWYEVRHQTGDYEHRFEAAPFIDFRYGDVPDTGYMLFGMSLKIAEAHRYRTAGETTWTFDHGEYTRWFVIDNVELGWTVGGNSEISYVNPYFFSPTGMEQGPSIISLAAYITGCFSQSAPVSLMLTTVEQLMNLSEGTPLDSRHLVEGFIDDTPSYKVRFDSDLYIEENGYLGFGVSGGDVEQFSFDVAVKTKDSSLDNNIWTTSFATYKFKFHWSNYVGQSDSIDYEGYVELEHYNNYAPVD